jgi:thioredoxin-like negative regulator of GroEL
VVVQFTHPLCTECRTVEAHLKSQGHSLVTVDVSTQRALARKYGVGVVPAAYFVNEDGRVLARLA